MAGRLERGVVLAILVAVALGSAGCTGATRPSQVHKHGTPIALQEVGPSTSGWAYQLVDIRSCRIGDAITTVVNRSSRPLRIVAVTASVTGSGPERETFSVLTLQRGNPGEVGATYNLTVLKGDPVRPAVGAILAPLAKSGKWYDLEVRVAITGVHPQRWAITGLRVTYSLAGKPYSVNFPQSVRLPPISTCRP